MMLLESPERLTEDQARELLEQFEPFILRNAQYWSKRYHGKIRPEEIASVGREQAWHSLLAFRGGHGTKVLTWVETGIWQRMRSWCNTESRRQLRRREQKLPTRKTPLSISKRSECILPARERVDPVAIERGCVADKILRVLEQELPQEDWQIFHRLHVEQVAQIEIATSMGITESAVSKRAICLLNKARLIIRKYPDLVAHDERGLVRSARGRGRPHKGPIYRRCRTRSNIYGYEWVNRAD